jgi:uncharacterized Fe-S cluster protein YjdI
MPQKTCRECHKHPVQVFDNLNKPLISPDIYNHCREKWVVYIPGEMSGLLRLSKTCNKVFDNLNKPLISPGIYNHCQEKWVVYIPVEMSGLLRLSKTWAGWLRQSWQYSCWQSCTKWLWQSWQQSCWQSCTRWLLQSWQ